MFKPNGFLPLCSQAATEASSPLGGLVRCNLIPWGTTAGKGSPPAALVRWGTLRGSLTAHSGWGTRQVPQTPAACRSWAFTAVNHLPVCRGNVHGTWATKDATTATAAAATPATTAATGLSGGLPKPFHATTCRQTLVCSTGSNSSWKRLPLQLQGNEALGRSFSIRQMKGNCDKLLLNQED